MRELQKQKSIKWLAVFFLLFLVSTPASTKHPWLHYLVYPLGWNWWWLCCCSCLCRSKKFEILIMIITVDGCIRHTFCLKGKEKRQSTINLVKNDEPQNLSDVGIVNGRRIEYWIYQYSRIHRHCYKYISYHSRWRRRREFHETPFGICWGIHLSIQTALEPHGLLEESQGSTAATHGFFVLPSLSLSSSPSVVVCVLCGWVRGYCIYTCMNWLKLER